MARVIGIGKQDFEDVIVNHSFYVDKTRFIREWWERQDSVTLISRPRRFGKTLNMSMVEKFFSAKYAGRGDLFAGLAIWEEAKYREMQGTIPVISLSFANVKDKSYENTRRKICQILVNLYNENSFLLDSDVLTDNDRRFFRSITIDMGDVEAALAIYQLSDYLSRYYGKKVIILLDEYDTPMQEAYVHGYWEELAAFTRSMFNAAFKTNPFMQRAIMTGITRVGKESIFSDLNNLNVVTTTSEEYADCFGFTKEEVADALKEYGLSEYFGEVEYWYDGFTFGSTKDIYNPWSIINYLEKGRFALYWANSSSNSLVGKLLRQGSRKIKMDFETLLGGGTLKLPLDEQIVFSQLDTGQNAIWSLLVAGGYLKVMDYTVSEKGSMEYTLAITNREVAIMFEGMVKGWFAQQEENYNDFIKALLADDLEGMNEYMNVITQSMFSYFDTGRNPSEKTEPERFYHGFVLGLMTELSGQYMITSNRESGFGRYDIMLEPKRDGLDAVIIEFKVHNPKKEASLEDTVQAALEQTEKKKYAQALKDRGISGERIRMLGFAFKGEQVLIGERPYSKR